MQRSHTTLALQKKHATGTGYQASTATETAPPSTVAKLDMANEVTWLLLSCAKHETKIHMITLSPQIAYPCS